jgi:large subunit ribosomal protein L30
MSKIVIKQTRSLIRRSPKQVATIKALGLGKIGRTAEHNDCAQLQGMIRVVSHLVEVKDV